MGKFLSPISKSESKIINDRAKSNKYNRGYWTSYIGFLQQSKFYRFLLFTVLSSDSAHGYKFFYLLLEEIKMLSVYLLYISRSTVHFTSMAPY